MGFARRVLLLIGLFLGLPHPVDSSAVPAGMVLIPAGEFVMGTDEVDSDHEALTQGLPHPWYEDEHPMRKVHLPSFHMDRHEVTHAEYQEFIRAKNHPAPPDWIDGTFPRERAKFPVAHVDWYDADAFCRWKGKRLPTEAEWEKAARGADGLLYPWGNTFNPDLANVAKKAELFSSTVPVGQYEAGKSPYGVYDMIGNVWEWTSSWYEPYPGNDASNENFGNKFRVNRGLSFVGVGHYPPKIYFRVASIVGRASFRSYDVPTARLLDLGFRCVKPVE